MTKTAAIYAGVSSDRQRERGTIASQTAAVREGARERGYVVPPAWVFEDDVCRIVADNPVDVCPARALVPA